MAMRGCTGFALVIGVVGACCCFGGSRARAQDFYLHNGDRVTFYGDSITAQRYYTRDIQDFVETRYPTLQVSFHNAGVPGDKVSGGYAGDAATRVTRDVKPWRPTVITVMLGMNDGDYVPPDPKIFAQYQSGYARLLALLRAAAPDARIALIENTPYDEITHGTEFAGFMATTEQNAAATPALGRREALPVIDDFTPMKSLLERAVAVNPSMASLLVIGRIHPSEPLHWIMAEAVIKAWHLDPVVSEVALSASRHSVVESRRTSVTGLTSTGDDLAWDQQDQALPAPFDLDDPLMKFVLAISDLASIDREMLKIDDLASGEYSLTIDKAKVGEFSAQQLAQGINLALKKTPMWHQAREYDAQIAQRSTMEDADLLLTASTSLSDRQEGSRILRQSEAVFEQNADGNLRIPVRHYTLTPLR
ncbi:MAG: GDSL-type esterase/lipase family protein [Acidobacteriaceae bacterium]